jgi:hypothetical protein
MSVVLATLLAPLPVTGYAFFFSIVYSRLDPLASLGISLVTYIFALAIAIALGLPLFWLALSLRLVHWWAGVIAGFLAGFLAAIALSGFHVMVANDLPLAVAGSAGGLLFWFVWSRDRRRHAMVDAI